ncbi:MAG TPA: hypothetical protein VFO29_05045 [Candidatus Rubrimentiphilum sp.]|nr:hypothetical protein [Candidatus Rubrimentiphilum sp.]
MATSVTPHAAARAAFTGLIDYAGLFPPAQLDMKEAVAEYGAARMSPNAWLLARFIVPESRLAEFLDQRAELDGERFPLSVIVDAGDDPRAWFGRVQSALEGIAKLQSAGIRVEALEAALPPLLSLRETYDATIGQYAAAVAQAGLRDLPSFIEVPRNDRRRDLLPGAIAAMHRHRLGAKLRCGGLNADAVPPVLDVATFLVEARDEGVAFKATAGLHHPIRGYNEASGFVMHGFLNLLVAAVLAKSGASLDELVAVLEDDDETQFRLNSDTLHWKALAFTAESIAETRAQSFAGYGSCSFDEPLSDLRSLGMIA